MLSGASRICCVGFVVMAPALRKADNAKGYRFPLIETLDIKQSFDLINAEKRLSDCGKFYSYSSSQPLSPPHCDILRKSSRYKLWISTARVSPTLLSDLGAKCNIDRRKKRKHSVRDGVDEPAIPSYHTMNRDISPVQDSMGLLNTNTSLDCDFKAHSSIGHQSAFTTVEQELLVMSPKGLEDPDDFSIFEVTSDNMEHPLTPPASRPGSVPVIAASSKVLPSTSVESLKKFDFQNTEAETLKNFSNLKTKSEDLMRRLRLVQTRQTELHCVQQLRNFVSHQQRNLGISCQRPPHSVSNRRTKEFGNLKTELFHSEDVKNLSTAALVKLVRRLESSHASTKLPHTQRGMWLDVEGRLADGNMTKLSSSECIETKRVTGTLLTNLRHLESCMDSDATESSSGGESCDEYDVQVNKKGSAVSIRRRAEWKWAVDRASVAARWIWLRAQVVDLEYNIRQLKDIHYQLQSSKQPLMFDCPVHADIEISTHLVDNSSETALCLSGSSKEIRNFSLANKHITKPVNGLLDSGTNGYHPVRGVLNSGSNSGQHVEHSIKQLSSSTSHASCCSSRTRPLSSFKKRKLFRTIGLHLSNKKAAQLSTVKCNCNCQCKMLPCALCGGRYNSIQTVDQDVMPVIDRIALLDPSFHPVISFEHEISYDLVVQKLLKYTEISKSLSQWGLHLKKKLHLSVPTKSLTNHSRKSTCRLARNAAQTLLSSAKLRKNFGSKKAGPKKKLVRTGKRKYVRKKQPDFGLSLVKKRPYRRRTLSVASSGSSKADSPVPSPSYWNTDGLGGNSFNSTIRPSILQDMLRRRKSESTFDINNIVIPYSVASSTRVEKIKYKEIVTPKWRLVEDALPLDIKEYSLPEDSEDISDEVYSERYGLCEREEKKRFSTIYTHAHPHGRIRSRSRGEIHADSSDGNTPDAISPHQLDILGQDSNSSINITDCLPTHGSSISMFLENSLSSIVTAYPNAERRRTASFTKKDFPDESRIDVEEVEVVPYEPYVFPLKDEVYEKMLENSPHLRENSPLLPLDNLPHSYPNSPVSPVSSSNSSVLDDDPCDPEWTVVSERGSHQSLVLKLAKR